MSWNQFHRAAVGGFPGVTDVCGCKQFAALFAMEAFAHFIQLSFSAVASDVFVKLETTFRECFCDSDRVMQLAKYMCRILDTVTRNFYEATCDSSVTDAVRDPVLGDVIKLFFKIRCQSFTENRSLVSGRHILRENKNRCEKI